MPEINSNILINNHYKTTCTHTSNILKLMLRFNVRFYCSVNIDGYFIFPHAMFLSAKKLCVLKTWHYNNSQLTRQTLWWLILKEIHTVEDEGLYCSNPCGTMYVCTYWNNADGRTAAVEEWVMCSHSSYSVKSISSQSIRQFGIKSWLDIG